MMEAHFALAAYLHSRSRNRSRAATGGDAAWLVLGHYVDSVAADAARFAPTLVVESPSLANALAEPYARTISSIVRDRQFDLVCAAASTFSKDILPRAAALVGGTMASDVLRHELVDGHLHFDCPQYAGAVTATLRLVGSPQVVTVRASAYAPAKPDDANAQSHRNASNRCRAANLAPSTKASSQRKAPGLMSPRQR